MDDRTLSTTLAAAARRFLVPGAQLVVHHAGCTATAVAGEVTVGTGEPMTPDTAVPIGSLTKPYTAALAMTLVADGDLELDSPVAEWLPGVAAGVTLRQLLSHTGGLAANVREDASGLTRRRWTGRGGGVEAVHPPGSAFSYSNAGFAVAGALVEAVTGLGWAEVLESVLLTPLGTVPSYVTGPARHRVPVTGHAASLRSGRVLTAPEPGLPELEAPNGALAASAADLADFAGLFVRVARPPPAGVFAEMCRDQLADVALGPFGLADGWGLGWARYGGTGDWWGHDGTGEGTSCHLRFEATEGTVVALTTNAGTGSLLWESLVDELRRYGVAVGDHPVTRLRDPAPVVLFPPEWTGRYANGDAEFAVRAAPGGRFQVAAGDRALSELTLHAGLRFVLRTASGGPASTGRFVRLPADGTRCLQVSGRLARRC